MDRNAVAQIVSKIQGTSGRGDYVNNIITMVNHLPENAAILEIGSQNGGSALTMALTLKEKNIKMFCIDPCFIKIEDRPEKCEQYAVASYTLDEFRGYIKQYGLENNVFPIPGLSEDILPIWEEKYNEKFDLIYIDADHTYNGVKTDIQWEKYAKEKAIIMLDDWIVDVEKATKEYLKNKPDWKVRVDHTFWPIYFTRNYPIVDIHRIKIK